MVIEHDNDVVGSCLGPPDHIKPACRSLARRYNEMWGLRCTLTDARGNTVARDAESEAPEAIPGHVPSRGRAIEEALRWGEPSMLLCPKGFVVWAVPVMENSMVVGGLVVEQVSVGARDEGKWTLSPMEIRHAARDLLTLAEEYNLTNAALLELRRAAAARESERAEVIRELKEINYQSIRDIYLKEEPGLISAIKRGDRASAREIINRILAAIYFFGRERPKLLKSFILELVVNMSRSAVEAGGDPSELLGANYSSFADLARIDTEEELCAWLVSMLERMMDAIKSNRQYPSTVLLGEALKFMQEHMHEELSRDVIADVACLSPSHFSRVVKQTFGQSFTELLSRMRVDKARDLLARTEKSLIQICLDCGFSDQSYFTKVFQRYTGSTPGEYRRTHRALAR
ncbi:MAG: helix-turn-helix domain-containing protein [Armatimonadetes bacterium]|nr:helix-turn-helix domain-containing protein [Armatimonadota bacterium]